MEKLDFVNKDILDKLDHEEKKSLADTAHALDMAAKKPEQAISYKGNGRTKANAGVNAAFEQGKGKFGRNANGVLQNAAEALKNGDLTSDEFKQISDSITNTLTVNPQNRKGNWADIETAKLNSKFGSYVAAGKERAVAGGNAAAVKEGNGAGRTVGGSNATGQQRTQAERAATETGKDVKNFITEASRPFSNDSTNSIAADDAELKLNQTREANRDKEAIARETEAKIASEIRRLDADTENMNSRRIRISKAKDTLKNSHNIVDTKAQEEYADGLAKQAENSVAGDYGKETEFSALDENGKPMKKTDDV